MHIIYFLFSQTLLFAIPLLIVALGGMFSERSGVVNLALEGIMVMGGFGGILFMHHMQNAMILSGTPLLLASLLVAGIVGLIFSLLHSFAAIHLKADQTISGTALNMLGPALAIFVAKTLQDGVQNITFENEFRIASIPILSKIPFIGPMFFENFYLTTFLGIIILLISWYVLIKTKLGLHIRSCGENPQAADAAGISVYKIRYIGVSILPISTEFTGTVAGYGFLALAVMIFGNWTPWRIAGASFFFGITKTLAYTYGSIPFLASLSLPVTVYKLIPYVATLVLLAFTSKHSAAPLADGIPYDKSKR